MLTKCHILATRLEDCFPDLSLASVHNVSERLNSKTIIRRECFFQVFNFCPCPKTTPGLGVSFPFPAVPTSDIVQALLQIVFILFQGSAQNDTLDTLPQVGKARSFLPSTTTPSQTPVLQRLIRLQNPATTLRRTW